MILLPIICMDAELSEAYDDKGISGGKKLTRMIRNVEEAVEP